MKKRRQPDYIQPARMLWEEDTSKTRTDKAASDIEKDSTPRYSSQNKPVPLWGDSEPKTTVPKTELTIPSNTGGRYSVVPVKDPYDARVRYETMEDLNEETELPTYRQILEQQVSDKKGRLEEL